MMEPEKAAPVQPPKESTPLQEQDLTSMSRGQELFLTEPLHRFLSGKFVDIEPGTVYLEQSMTPLLVKDKLGRIFHAGIRQLHKVPKKEKAAAA